MSLEIRKLSLDVGNEIVSSESWERKVRLGKLVKESVFGSWEGKYVSVLVQNVLSMKAVSKNVQN